MQGLAFDAARKLSVGAVRMKELDEDNSRLKDLIEDTKARNAARKHTVAQIRRSIEQHRLNRNKLLAALDKMNVRDAQLEEDVRLMTEDRLSVQQHAAHVEVELSVVLGRIQLLQEQVKRAEADRQEMLVRTKVDREALATLVRTLSESSAKRNEKRVQLKKIQASGVKYDVASKYVESALLQNI